MKRTVLAVTVVALLAGACGGGNDNPAIETEGPTTTAPGAKESTGTTGPTAAGTRTVEIKMVDIAFQPSTLSVKRGDSIEFVFRNEGAIAHDAFIGDSAAQAEHEAEMRQGDQSSTSGGHDEGEGDQKGVTVDPGQTGRLSYTFDDEPGTLEIGCHQPGHYAAGMKVVVTVV